jgi:GDPmannose 4,6-dehydratase
MWLILQQDKADDYVIATGKTTTVREFIKLAFNEVGIKVRFEGEGVDEKGIIESIDRNRFEDLNKDLKVGAKILSVDPRYFRPTEVELLIGDPEKAKSVLGWKPKYDLEALVKEMVQADINLFKKDLDLINAGHKVLNQAE